MGVFCKKEKIKPIRNLPIFISWDKYTHAHTAICIKLQQQKYKLSINLPSFFRKIRHKSTYNHNFSSKDIVYFISFIDINYLKQGTQLKKLLDYSHFSLGCQRNSKLRWARSLLNKPEYLKELLSLSLFY